MAQGDGAQHRRGALRYFRASRCAGVISEMKNHQTYVASALVFGKKASKGKALVAA